VTVLDMRDLRDWVGRSETRADIATAAPLADLAALLDDDPAQKPPEIVPPLGHWLYFHPSVARSLIGDDGHPRTGDFLPPVPLPRRMWAGSDVHFLAPIPVGAPIERRSVVSNVIHKVGKSGDLIFVAVDHVITTNSKELIVERQDLVYRGPHGDPAASQTPPSTQVDEIRGWVITPTPIDLFRFSALTFNAHRIHYDRDYARNVEGHADLLVQAPFAATLLMKHLMREMPEIRVKSFAFRAKSPLLANREMKLMLAPQADCINLTATDNLGVVSMTGTAEISYPQS
jgi:3-methylfumaryl-CoA hydratase